MAILKIGNAILVLTAKDVGWLVDLCAVWYTELLARGILDFGY